VKVKKDFSICPFITIFLVCAKDLISVLESNETKYLIYKLTFLLFLWESPMRPIYTCTCTILPDRYGSSCVKLIQSVSINLSMIC